MKIAYLLGSLNRGGTETMLLDVFKDASIAKFDFIGIHRKGGVLQSEFYATGQKMIHLIPKFSFDIFYLFRLRFLLKNEKINIVHAQQSLDALYAWLACLGTNIKIVQTLHGYDNISSKKIKLLSFIIKHTDLNIFVSNTLRNYYVNKYNLKRNKQTVVYNGVSFGKFNSNTESELLPYKDPNKFLLGSVGNFIRGRDQLTICRFLHLLNEMNIDFDFVFVGAKSDNYASHYDVCVDYCKQKKLLGKVHFLGSRNDVPVILKQLDAFIYSSDHDTFGIAVVEAIAIGIPVFVNDLEVMLEITNKGDWAIIYKTKNEQDLLRKFLAFIEKNQFSKEKNIIAQVRKEYSIEKHIQSLFENYQQLYAN